MKNIVIILVISALGGGLAKLGTPPLPPASMSSNIDDYGAKKGAPPAPAPMGPASATPSVAGGNIIIDDVTPAPGLTVSGSTESPAAVPDNIPQSFKAGEMTVHGLAPENVD